MEKKKIIIAGGTGFIGKYLTGRFREALKAIIEAKTGEASLV